MLPRLALFGLVFAATQALAGVCGDPNPDNRLGAGSAAYAPIGEAVRLRLEVVEPSITCDGATHEVRVWLDDLPSQPTPLPPVRNILEPDGLPTPAPPTNTGVSAFQFKISYDPAVVWVREKANVQIPQGLDDAPPSPSIARNFTPAAHVDNNAGYVFVGGLALGLTSDHASTEPAGLSTPLAIARGVDPLAAGAPIQLMTIGLTAIGAGETKLTIEEVELFADSAYTYAPVETTGAIIEVAGECAKMDTPTPYPPTTSPSPASTETLTGPPEYRPISLSAAVSVRPDCNTPFATDLGVFSACVPDGWIVDHRAAGAGYPEAVTFTDHATGTFVGISIVESTPMSRGAVADIGEFCAVLTSATGITFSAGVIALDNTQAEVCTGEGTAGDLGADPVYAFARLSDGRFLQIEVTRPAGRPEGDAASQELLGELRVDRE